MANLGKINRHGITGTTRPVALTTPSTPRLNRGR